MDNLRNSIDILFRKINPDEIINKSLNGKSTDISIDEFLKHTSHLAPHYSINEQENIYHKLTEDWWLNKEGEESIIHLLGDFTNSVLTEEKGNPKVVFEYLLRWRELSHTLGEDLFTCSYLAEKDLKLRGNRTYFSWRPVIDSNNVRLKQLLSKGMTENHFHLKGSAPHAQLSWIALMNNVQNRLSQFRTLLKKGHLQEGVERDDKQNHKLYFLVLKAAVIRLKLFSLLMGESDLFYKNDPKKEKQYFENLLKDDSNKKDSLFLISQIQTIQEKIDIYVYEYAHKIKHYGGFRPDYALIKSIGNNDKNNDSENQLLCGERWFMYQMFKKFLERNKEGNALRNYDSLFYAYLVIKEKFREELIQVNNRIGFANFSNYQDRKELFIDDNPYLKKALHRLAVRSTTINQGITSFESRIAPKNCVNDLDNKIKDIAIDIRLDSEALQNDLHSFMSETREDAVSQKHFHVLHFIKKKERQSFTSVSEEVSMVKCRDYELREEVKLQAHVIADIRERGRESATKIYGIDAASSEFDARPEVFATSFRYLKNHYPYRDNALHFDYSKIPQLRQTYHAGEDFYDLVDGMRTIDETIKFLEFGQGDRIGHGLALGIDATEYYKNKGMQLMLPRQVLLDNYAWLLSRLIKYGMHEFSSLQAQIIHDFRVLFESVYGGLELLPDHICYYQAWTLRADEPQLYKSGKYLKKEAFTHWDHYLLNTHYVKDVFRNDTKVTDLLVAYHFNKKVKTEGSKIKRFDIRPDYIEAVKIIQKKLQIELLNKHIAIECNPTSNVLIGNFNRYDKHPILNFYNLGLTTNMEDVQNCPQLMVSINTDDQGVFNTYLENEYALMALAMEKAKDEKGNAKYKVAMIYDWLERVRRMGEEMSFKKK